MTDGSVGPGELAGDDRLTVAILERVLSPDSNAVDVGANAGQILREIVRLAPLGSHLAFEPIPYLAEGLRREFPRVTVVAAAAGEADGETSFHHVRNDPGYSGIRMRRYDRPDPDLELLVVPVRRLDGSVPPGRRIRFVKIDVEGGELQVLRGATGLLSSDRPFVLFEHGQGASEFYGTKPEDLFELLSGGLGYRIHTLGGFLAGGAPLGRGELRSVYDSGSAWNFLAAP